METEGLSHTLLQGLRFLGVEATCEQDRRVQHVYDKTQHAFWRTWSFLKTGDTTWTPIWCCEQKGLGFWLFTGPPPQASSDITHLTCELQLSWPSSKYRCFILWFLCVFTFVLTFLVEWFHLTASRLLSFFKTLMYTQMPREKNEWQQQGKRLSFSELKTDDYLLFLSFGRMVTLFNPPVPQEISKISKQSEDAIPHVSEHSNQHWCFFKTFIEGSFIQSSILCNMMYLKGKLKMFISVMVRKRWLLKIWVWMCNLQNSLSNCQKKNPNIH